MSMYGKNHYNLKKKKKNTSWNAKKKEKNLRAVEAESL